jgi:hypothetical protein
MPRQSEPGFSLGETTVKLDADVEATLAFMQANIPTSRLVAVATAIAKLSPLLWGCYSAEDILPIMIEPAAISG